MSGPTLVARLLLRPRTPVALSLVLLSATAWALLIHQSSTVALAPHTDGMRNLDQWCRSIPPTVEHAPMLLTMWLLMSVAMMLPTAAPAILTFADLAERACATERHLSPPAFIAGYLLVWVAFAIFATLTQLGLSRATLALPAAVPALTLTALLLLAGAYQFAPLKHACLTKCRNPMTYFLAHWREGAHGALTMGLQHGAYCVGCCWALMLLMIAAGTMNAGFTAALAVLMLVEKVAPAGEWVGRVVGVALVCWGLLRLVPMVFNS